VKEEKSGVLYIVADAFREKLSQILGQELSTVAHFDGNYTAYCWSLREPDRGDVHRRLGGNCFTGTFTGQVPFLCQGHLNLGGN